MNYPNNGMSLILTDMLSSTLESYATLFIAQNVNINQFHLIKVRFLLLKIELVLFQVNIKSFQYPSIMSKRLPHANSPAKISKFCYYKP